MDKINKMLWCVYMHINKINHKVYIGVAKGKPEKRWGKWALRPMARAQSTLFLHYCQNDIDRLDKNKCTDKERRLLHQ